MPAKRRKPAEKLPDRDELLQNLARGRFDRSVNVAAVKLLLEELRRDHDDEGSKQDAFADLDAPSDIEEARRRRRQAS